MDELFRQLAFINAILGGFAGMFVSVLLTAESKHRIIDWVVAVLLSAASCFIVSALGATFCAVIAVRITSGDLPDYVLTLYGVISILFLLGNFLLFVSLGMTGWLRSRPLGIATVSIAAISLIGAFFVMKPFMTY